MRSYLDGRLFNSKFFLADSSVASAADIFKSFSPISAGVFASATALRNFLMWLFFT